MHRLGIECIPRGLCGSQALGALGRPGPHSRQHPSEPSHYAAEWRNGEGCVSSREPTKKKKKKSIIYINLH